MPTVGELVTVFDAFGLRTGKVTDVYENVVNGEDGTPCCAFTVSFENESYAFAGVHLWSFDPDFEEGVGWVYGWDGPAVDALRAARALM